MNEYLSITDTTREDEIAAEVEEQFKSDLEYCKLLTSLTDDDETIERDGRQVEEILNREEYNQYHIAEILCALPKEYWISQKIGETHTGRDRDRLQRAVIDFQMKKVLNAPGEISVP